MKQKLKVDGLEITLISEEGKEYISLTEMARFKDMERTNYIIQNWIRSRNTLEFIGLWEILHNPAFKRIEFDAFLFEAGANSFSMTPYRWIEATQAIGITSKAGRNGGTFAHKDIAFEFASWLSPTFKLYFIKDYQRLKDEENSRLKLDWNLQRTLAKVNYHIHTDAIKENLIPEALTKKQASFVYASEADLLNMALFGKTAAEWRTENPKLVGNMRDHATLEQLVVMTNLESLNAVLITQGMPSQERILQLNRIAIQQLQTLLHHAAVKRLRSPE